MTTIATCNSCGDVLQEGNRVMRSVSKKGKHYYLSQCKPCLARESVIRRNLHKSIKPPKSGDPCELCGRIDKLFLDHDHYTGEFRGWICCNCNSALGKLGDSKAGLLKALTYLEKAEVRSSNRSRSPTIDKNKDSNHVAN